MIERWAVQLGWGGVLLLAFLLAGCDTAEQQRDFEEAARSAPSGFTRTDANGRVLEADDDDWRTAPAYASRLLVSPAWPNPVQDGPVTVPFSVYEFDAFPGGLEIGSFDETGRFTQLDAVPQADDAGGFEFIFNPAVLGRRTGSLIRLYVVDARGVIISYGDLQL